MKTNEEIIKKFDGFVKELNTTQEFIRNKNSLIYKFGYKTLKGDEIFTVVDWGNIRKCILELLSQQKQEIISGKFFNEITINEKLVTVKKLALGKYGELLQAVDELPKEVTNELSKLEVGKDGKGSDTFFAKLPIMLGKSWDKLINVLAVATSLEADYLAKECDLVDGANLLKAVFEVNDFLAVKNALAAAFQKKETTVAKQTGSGK